MLKNYPNVVFGVIWTGTRPVPTKRNYFDNRYIFHLCRDGFHTRPFAYWYLYDVNNKMKIHIPNHHIAWCRGEPMCSPDGGVFGVIGQTRRSAPTMYLMFIYECSLEHLYNPNFNHLEFEVFFTCNPIKQSVDWHNSDTLSFHHNSMINFVYDPEKDLKLIQKWKEENYSIRENDEEWLKINKQRQISLIDEYSKIEIDPNNQFIKDYINFIQTEREKVEDNFLKKIGDFFEIQISTMPNIACYLTRSGRYPYYFNHATTIEEAEYLKSRENEQEPKRDMFGIANEEWFACPMFQWPFATNSTIMHELIHYFQPNLLPQSIKEAIPCILNASTTFMNYWSDNGHQEVEEQNWRKIIWELYKVKKGKFSDLTKLTDENISADYHLSNGYSYLL